MTSIISTHQLILIIAVPKGDGSQQVRVTIFTKLNIALASCRYIHQQCFITKLIQSLYLLLKPITNGKKQFISTLKHNQLHYPEISTDWKAQFVLCGQSEVSYETPQKYVLRSIWNFRTTMKHYIDWHFLRCTISFAYLYHGAVKQLQRLHTNKGQYFLNLPWQLPTQT